MKFETWINSEVFFGKLLDTTVMKPQLFRM